MIQGTPTLISLELKNKKLHISYPKTKSVFGRAIVLQFLSQYNYKVDLIRPDDMKKTLLLFLVPLILGCQSFDSKENVIYLAGDSTMSDKKPEKRPETGWGEMLGDYFVEGIQIENHAQNGRSSRSFIAEKRWKTIVEKLEKGDVVFIQFGHNDTKKDDRFSTPKQYGENLLKFVNETRAKKATPILVTPVVRRRFDESGKFYDTHGDYPDVVRNLAATHKVALLDLHRLSSTLLSELGEEDSESLFLWLEKGENANYPDGKEDNTHFSAKGAKMMAGLIVEEIRSSELSIRDYLKAS